MFWDKHFYRRALSIQLVYNKNTYSDDKRCRQHPFHFPVKEPILIKKEHGPRYSHTTRHDCWQRDKNGQKWYKVERHHWHMWETQKSTFTGVHTIYLCSAANLRAGPGVNIRVSHHRTTSSTGLTTLPNLVQTEGKSLISLAFTFMHCSLQSGYLIYDEP